MSATRTSTTRQQRLVELLEARARLDKRIRTLARTTPPVEPPPPAAPTFGDDWLEVAHRNQVHLELLGPHVKHTRRVAP